MNGFFHPGANYLLIDVDDGESIKAALSAVLRLPPSFAGRLDRREASAWAQFETLKVFARMIIAEKEKGHCLLSPQHFSFGNPRRVPPQIADIFLNESELGRDVLATFASLGIPDLITLGVKSKESILFRMRAYRMHLAALVMCTGSAKNFKDIDKDEVYKWISYYYNFDELSFKRTDLFPHQLEYHKKTFKIIAKEIGRHLHEPSIIELGLTRRKNRESSFSFKAILKNPPPALKKWVALWQQWRAIELSLSKSPMRPFAYLIKYLLSYGDECADPESFLKGPRKMGMLDAYMSVRVQKGLKELTTSDEFPKLIRFSNFVSSELFECRGVLCPYPLVPIEDVRNYKKLRRARGLDKRPHEAEATPLPIHYYDILREILEEGEDGWPGRHKLCRAFLKGEHRYVPVLPTLFLTLFDIPLRTVQVRRLDSGEGDEEAFNGITQTWKSNRGIHAAYWRKLDGVRSDRGYARRTNSQGVTGFFINTNKHSAPYVVPWQNADLHRRLYELRIWQERWNPVNGPVQLKYDGDPEEGAQDRLPIVFALFRMPAGRNAIGTDPLTYSQCNRFWLDLMLELQTRWNERALPEDRDVFVKMGKSGNQAQASRYTAHGMRVAGITILLQAGMPIELISKLFAGHATILQSLYYSKFQADYLQAMFDQVNLSKESMRRAELFRDAKTMRIDEARIRLVGGSADAISAAYSTLGLWERRDIGICPFSGQRCGDGNPNGSLVEGGPGNCLLCRHHLTAPEYAFGVWAHGNHLLFRLSRMNRRIMAITAEIDQMDEELAVLEKSDPRYAELHEAKRRSETVRNSITLDQVPVAKSLTECVRLLHVFEEMERRGVGTEAGCALVASSHSTLEFEEASNIEQAFLLAKNAEIFKSTYDPEVHQELINFAQNAAIRCGYEPIAMRARSPDQIRKASEYATQRILQEVSRGDLLLLESGAIDIVELLDPQVSSDIFTKGLQLSPLNAGSQSVGQKLAGAIHGR